MIPSVANGQSSIFLNSNSFCHENYLVLAHTQLFHQLPLPKCPCMCDIYVRREPSGTAWQLLPFACVKFFKLKITLGSKFRGDNHPRKLTCLKILAHKLFFPQKRLRLWYVPAHYTDFFFIMSRCTCMLQELNALQSGCHLFILKSTMPCVTTDITTNFVDKYLCWI